ncbi:hypothetical protein [Flagellimonas myxillae]|uniref:hypothetical protein n=1 Tax=Flagellimonas myxillae TaxID=2942214 RepID=UPI00201EA5E7|nr:hypothetical protein [Muricauda myxillae]MCL6267388.1 hypothetical protein [Muricauda myxillae]
MNAENINIWCWIIPALVGVLAGILGYLIGKGKDATVVDTSTELKALEAENLRLKTELEACNQKQSTNVNPVKEGIVSSAQIAPSKETQSFDAAAAKAAMRKRIKENDLKIVEGIGPKIEGLFHNFGIKTWKDLSEVSTVKCQEVLNSGGDRYRIHDPASWPMQAKMAHKGQWTELAKWQDKHKSGKF